MYFKNKNKEEEVNHYFAKRAELTFLLEIHEKKKKIKKRGKRRESVYLLQNILVWR